LKEYIFTIDFIDPVEFFGVNNNKIRILQQAFPNTRILGRGDEIKIIGEGEDLLKLQTLLQTLVTYAEKYDKLPEEVIQQAIKGKTPVEVEPNGDNDVILFGSEGQPIKARTANQKKLVEQSRDNDIVFTTGPAGTGKTYVSVAIAVKALKHKQVKRIILTRPAVEAGENLGFLPGDMKEKIDPYLRPLYDALNDLIPAEKLAKFLENNTIEIAPLAFMRGRTLDNAFVILDEAQNCTRLQIKMFLTRMGPMAKFIINGDLTQIDLPTFQNSGLYNAIDILSGIDGIGLVEFSVEDVIRHRLVKKIVTAYSNESKDKQEKEIGDSKN
jgi:phosphate starvation-inducible protein PhoH and related proteins